MCVCVYVFVCVCCRALQEAQEIFGIDFDFDEFEQYDEDEEEDDIDDDVRIDSVYSLLHRLCSQTIPVLASTCHCWKDPSLIPVLDSTLFTFGRICY